MYISELEGLGGFGGKIPSVCIVLAHFVSFWSVVCVVKIQDHFGSSPVQIFRQYNLNSILNFGQIPVVISKLPI